MNKILFLISMLFPAIALGQGFVPGKNPIVLTGISAPGLSTSNQARIYYDGTKVYISKNGAAYAEFGAAATGITIGDAVTNGTDTAVLFVHGAGILAQDATHFQYTNGAGQLDLTGTSPYIEENTGSGGSAISCFQEVSGGIGYFQCAGAGLSGSVIYYGSLTSNVTVSFQTAGLDSMKIRADRVVEIVQPIKINTTDSNTTCNLNGSSPSSCTATVSTAHTCRPFCTLGALSTPSGVAPGCVRSGSTITATGGNGDASTVNILCL